MKVLCWPRQAGKTTALIKMAAANNGYIVCINQQHCDYVADQAKRLGLKINDPITHKEFIEGKLAKKSQAYTPIRKVYIDEVEHLLQLLAGNMPIGAASLSAEVMVPNKHQIWLGNSEEQ